MDRARKEALIEELKHYINGKFAELKKELSPKEKAVTAAKPIEPKKVAKVEREKATRG